MKKLLALLVITGLMGLSLLVTPAPAGDLAPTVVAANPYQKLDNKAKVTIVGTGFKPGQEVSVLFTTVDGVQTDIGYALKPAPKANKIGSWVTTWSCGRFIKKKLIAKGAYTITVTDSDYNVITHAPVAFYAEKKAKKKKK